MVRCKGSMNSHASTVQERVTANTNQNMDLAAKMDRILGVIQGYEGKTDTTMELMLDMQKRFEGKLEALREDNGEIKAWIDGKKNDLKREKSPKNSEEGERSLHKSQKDKDQSTRGAH